MTIRLDNLERAYLAVKGDPLARAWIHRDTSAIRIVDAASDGSAPPSPSDAAWVEVPTPQELHLRTILVEAFVQEHCPHLALPVARCFGRQDPWRSFQALLGSHRYLDEWLAYEEQALREALRQWADEHALVS